MHNLKEVFLMKKSSGKSQKEASAYLKIDHRSVSRHMTQKNLGINILNKYAEYLEVDLAEIVTKPVKRQINGYIFDHKIFFYEHNEERPLITLRNPSAKWWGDKSTIIIQNKTKKNSYYYGDIILYENWKSALTLKGKERGIVKMEDGTFQSTFIEPKEQSEDHTKKPQFLVNNCFSSPQEWETVKLTKYAKWLCTYSSESMQDYLL